MIIEIDDKIVTPKKLEELLAWLQDKGLNPVVKGMGNGEVAIKCDVEDKEEEIDEKVEEIIEDIKA